MCRRQRQGGEAAQESFLEEVALIGAQREVSEMVAQCKVWWGRWRPLEIGTGS